MGFQRVENVEEFDMSRLIYARDYTKIKEVYSDHNIPADLGVVIGAITESEKAFQM